MRPFRWTKRRQQAALFLAQAYTEQETADRLGIARETVSRWYRRIEFATEVDRLSLMVDISGRAERLRLAMKAIRQKVGKQGDLLTDKDMLDWLKFAQSETDGARINIVGALEELLAAQSAISSPVAGSGQGGDSTPPAGPSNSQPV